MTLEAARLKVPDAHHVWSAVMDEVTTRSPDRLVEFIANPELRLRWIEVRTVDASQMEYEWTFKAPEHETTPLRFRARVTSESSRWDLDVHDQGRRRGWISATTYREGLGSVAARPRRTCFSSIVRICRRD